MNNKSYKTYYLGSGSNLLVNDRNINAVVITTARAIKDLKITVRKINNDDIKERNLPNQTKGLVITQIENDSPLINQINDTCSEMVTNYLF